MKPITLSLKDSRFEANSTLDSWLWLLKILGDPLKFVEKVQIK